MRKRLPAYIVNCLLAAGYDSADVISSMDVSGPIEVIETFIDKHFRGNEEYYSNPMLATNLLYFRLDTSLEFPTSSLRSVVPLRVPWGVSGSVSAALNVGSSKCHLSKLPRTVREDAVEPEP